MADMQKVPMQKCPVAMYFSYFCSLYFSPLLQTLVIFLVILVIFSLLALFRRHFNRRWLCGSVALWLLWLCDSCGSVALWLHSAAGESGQELEGGWLPGPTGSARRVRPTGGRWRVAPGHRRLRWAAAASDPHRFSVQVADLHYRLELEREPCHRHGIGASYLFRLLLL